MKTSLIVVLISPIILFLVSQAAKAAINSSLYEYSILVPETMTQPDRDALHRGFESVLLKVSASYEVKKFFQNRPANLEHFLTDIALVDTFQVIEDVSGNASLARKMTLTFDQEAVIHWLNQRDIDVPGTLRPDIELRYSSTISESLVKTIRQQSIDLGIPLTLTPDPGNSYQIIFENQDASLISRILVRSGKRGIIYLDQSALGYQLVSYSEAGFQTVIVDNDNKKQLVEGVFSTYLSQYTKRAESVGFHVIHVVGVKSLSQINEMMNFLSQLLSIDKVMLREHNDDHLVVELRSNLDAQQLNELLGFQKRMLLQTEDEPPVWRWIGRRVGARN